MKKSILASKILLIVAILVISASCTQIKKQSKPATVPEVQPDILSGYLTPENLPDSLALLPPPPAPDSIAFALDNEVSQESMTLSGSPRWNLAVRDADLMFPQAADTFSCALSIRITEEDTPHLYILLRRTLADAGFSTYNAKKHYQRPRPFAVNSQPTCTPDAEDNLRKNGSYPSGHTTIGWAWALILSEIVPENGDAILARGRAYGESRIICNVHWQSDVIAGRFMGAATVARLHGDPDFQADLAAAKNEIAAIQAKGLSPLTNCDFETWALSHPIETFSGEAAILQSWQGDFPVAQLILLPENQRTQPGGYIMDIETFNAVWKKFQPQTAAPDIDFKNNMILFVRNTRFYNRNRIGKVQVKDGVAEVLAMETLSARPIEDKVAMSMVVVARKGIKGLQTGNKVTIIPEFLAK